MPDFEFDIVVIGTGPGGEGAAMQAAKRGRSVAVVEREPLIGGNCTHVGTIPSKALRYAIYQMMSVNANPLYRQHGISVHLTIPELLRASRGVIDKQVAMRTNFYERNDVPILHGTARFQDPHHLEIQQPDGARQLVRGESFIIAVGARPYRPADIEFDGDRVFDSDTILTLRRPLRTITIYGAGVIGCEYASMFRNLDSKVNLVNTRSKLLEFLDDEIIDALSYHLRDRGVLIRHNEEYERVELLDDGVVVHMKSGKALKSDALLWASGRTGNSDSLNLAAAGLTADRRGNLPVNEHMQTEVPHVYAVGDINGVPALASAAYMQGRYAASHILGERELPRVTDVPTGIYTSPEISSLGKTERELTAEKVPYEVGHSQFKSLARAQITGQTVGMLKLLFHRETLEVLGIHCFGANASEIIHIGQAIMRQPAPNNTLRYFVNTTFNYPTMAEAYRVAALNGLNRLF